MKFNIHPTISIYIIIVYCVIVLVLNVFIWTAVHFAAAGNHLATLQLLIDKYNANPHCVHKVSNVNTYISI